MALSQSLPMTLMPRGGMGTVDITFRNFPLDPRTLEFASNMLITIVADSTSVLEKESKDG